jgi:hypothetical protein
MAVAGGSDDAKDIVAAPAPATGGGSAFKQSADLTVYAAARAH